MNSYNEWNPIKNQLEKITKDLPAKTRSNINYNLYKTASNIMEKKSLSLIFDDFGNQLYEKTQDVKNFISCKNNGFNISFVVDESKLIKKNIFLEDDFTTDFIQATDIKDISEKNIKENIDVGFKYKNDYLYKKQQQEDMKNKVFKDGIKEIKSWFNTKGLADIKKESKDFSIGGKELI